MYSRRILIGVLSAWVVLGFDFSRPSESTAGPNAGGTLIVHACPTVCFSDSDPKSYCPDFQLDVCHNANTREDSGIRSLWWIAAAFAETSSPRLSAVIYGIDYDPDSVVLSYDGTCGDFSLYMPDWPAPGSGNAVAWNEAQTDFLVPITYFVGYAYAHPATFSVIGHPTGGGSFADDEVPANLDPVVGYGTLGFGTDGFLPCPDPGVPTDVESWGRIKTRYR